jgi:hypothetical protein
LEIIRTRENFGDKGLDKWITLEYILEKQDVGVEGIHVD